MLLALAIFLSCQSPKSESKMHSYKISLAQWSLHRAIEAGTTDPIDFAKVAKQTYGIDAIEYVNGFYNDQASDKAFWESMKKRADDHGVTSLLIMVDDEGDLGADDETERKQAVENHYKWVDAAKILGCHSIRVNAFGDTDINKYKPAIIDGLSRLSEYGAKRSINILIENHGLFSADGALMVEVIKSVNSPYLGTLPDFGNWCMSAKWGSTQEECDQVYDRYQGVADFMPFAKGVSAKSYNFNETGEDRIIDYKKMFNVVGEFDYKGYVGIEYEGTEKGEHEGILLTKALLEKIWRE